MKKNTINKLLNSCIGIYMISICFLAIFIYWHKKNEIKNEVAQKLKNATNMGCAIVGKKFLINAITDPSKNSKALIWDKISSITKYNFIHGITAVGFEAIKNGDVYDLVSGLRKKYNLIHHIRLNDGDDPYNTDLSEKWPNSAKNWPSIINSSKEEFFKDQTTDGQTHFYNYYKRIKLPNKKICVAYAGLYLKNVEEKTDTAVLISLITFIVFLILVVPIILLLRASLKEDKRILEEKNNILIKTKKELENSNKREENLRIDAEKAWHETEIERDKAKQLKVEAEKQRDNAIKINQMKDQFFANMSHDFRTPLNAIIGFNKQIKDEIKTPKINQITQNIKMSAEYMLHFTEDLLDFARMEQSGIEYIPEIVDINKMGGIFGSHFLQKADYTRKNFNIQISGDLPLAIESSERRLFQIVNNLVGNAFKFTNDSGKIDLKLEYSQKKELVIIVRDDGIGIPIDKIDVVFEKFSKLNNKNNGSGAGLGLYITKNIVEKMGGKISVKSVYKKYTEFKVVLPLIEVKAHASFENLQEKFLERNKNLEENDRQRSLRGFIDQVVESTRKMKLFSEKKDGEEVRKLLHDLIAPASFYKFYEFTFYIDKMRAEIKAKKTNYSKVGKYADVMRKGISELTYPQSVLPEKDIEKIKKTKILVVDDNKQNVMILQIQLAKYSYRADVAYSGQEALFQVKLEKYKVIFIDINMPVMDGKQLLKKLRKNKVEALMMAYTAEGSQNAQQKLLDYGFDEVFIKPVDETELVSILNFANGIEKEKTVIDIKKKRITKK